MTFGDSTDEGDAFGLLDAFLEAGGNFIDTADVYAGGLAESIVGKWLTNRPSSVSDSVVIATKGRFATASDPNGVGLSRRHLGRALDESLRRLQVETIDLYQVHGWDPVTPMQETIGFLDDAVHAGKIRYTGLSNFLGWQAQAAIDAAKYAGKNGPITIQPQYNLLTRETEWELLGVCEHNGLGLLPWSPLAGGVLSGKYSRNGSHDPSTRLGGSRYAAMFGQRIRLDQTWAVLATLEEVAANRGVTVAQASLTWLLGRPAVSSVILGARTLEQLVENLGSVDFLLEDDEINQLNAVSTPEIDYPYGGPTVVQRERSLNP
jgi:aryl-alcohol dehydrogenase-like predicted oxidoreductase